MANEKKDNVKILVIDDVESNRLILKTIISDMGYQPIMAENGVQALKIIELFSPQLIITDIAMPQMDGIELCERLKGKPETRDIPLLFISAHTDSSDIVKGFEVGAEDYISKPLLPEVVKARVRLHLKLHDSQIELSEMNRRMKSSLEEQLRLLEAEKRNVLYALVRVARANAAYDDRHMERLCRNCRLMAEALQLSTEFGSQISDAFVETLELAAPLCDLGNVSIPIEILQKTEALNEQDRQLIKTHVEIGSKIIRDIQNAGEYNEFLQMSYEIARYHHECYDGKGYPEQLVGEQIPLSAQIVAVISSYCALTEKRVYREAFSKEEAVSIIQKQAGTKFNQEICKVLGMIYRQLE